MYVHLLGCHVNLWSFETNFVWHVVYFIEILLGLILDNENLYLSNCQVVGHFLAVSVDEKMILYCQYRIATKPERFSI